MSSRGCLVCGSRTEQIFEKQSPPFGDAVFFKCSNCDFVQSDHIERAAPSEVADFYANCSFDRDDPGYLARAETAVAAILLLCKRRGIDPGALKLLDYGCGEGSFVKLCRKAGIDAVGFDPYYSGKSNLYLAGEGGLSSKQGGFDIVTAIEVVEHATTPSVFSALAENCAAGGMIFFTTGIFDPRFHRSDWSYFVPAHCSIYSAKSLELLAVRLGLSREHALRFAFSRIPFVLTGEVWIKSQQPDVPILDSTQVLEADRKFHRASSYIGNWLSRPLSQWIYRGNGFLSRPWPWET